MKRWTLLTLVVAAIVGSPVLVEAHCQIPCGIYDDELRVQLIEEHIGTVEKSMQQIIALGKEQPVNMNQLVRWIDNKEQHAQEIQDIVTAYFMAQRVKPKAENTEELRAQTVKPVAPYSGPVPLDGTPLPGVPALVDKKKGDEEKGKETQGEEPDAQ